MEVNLTGNFLTLKHAAPLLRRSGGGAYTAISSVAAVIPCRFLAPYTTAKAGVDMLVRTPPTSSATGISESTRFSFTDGEQG